MKKLLLCLKIFIWVAVLFSVRVEAIELPPEYRDFVDSLPEGVEDTLDGGMLYGDADGVIESVNRMSGVGFLFKLFLNSLGRGISEMLPHILLLLGIVILSSIGGAMASHSPTHAKILDICSRLTVFASVGWTAISLVGDVKAYLTSLFATVTAFIPLSGALYGMGGNISTASGSGIALTLILAVVQIITVSVAIPLFCFCMALSFCSAVDPEINAAGLGAAIKKPFMSILAIIMSVLAVSLSAQTLICSRSDSVAMRGAKILAGTGIPVTGGTVSATLGTLASGVELLRGAVGIGGIIVIAMALLPMLIKLWCIRASYSLLSGASGILGSGGARDLLASAGELYGLLEGTCVLCSLIFVLALALFCSTGAALI